MKVRTSLIIMLAVFSVLAASFFAVFMSVVSGNDAHAQYDRFTEQLAYIQQHSVLEYFDDYSLRVAQIVDNYEVQNFSKYISANPGLNANSEQTAIIDKTLQAYATEGTDIAAIALVGSDNAVYYSVGDQSLLTKVRDFDLAASEYIFYCYSQSSADSTQTYYIYTVAPLTDNVYLACSFFADDFVKQAKLSAFPDSGRVYILDPNLWLFDVNFVGDLRDIYMPEYHELKTRLLNTDDPTKTESFSYAIGKNIRDIFLLPVGDTGWRVATVSEADKAYAFSNASAGVMSNLAWIMGIVLIAGSILFIVLFTRPLHQIEETLVKLRKGDHEARMNVVINNEYGEIANQFNDLLDNVVVSEGRYRTIIEMADNIIFEWNFSTNEVVFSNNFNKKFSYRAPSDRYDDSFLVKCKVHPDDAKRYYADLAELAKGNVFKHKEYRWKNIYGDYIWVLMRTSVITDRNGQVIKVVGVIVDIDRAKKSEKILTTRASYDALTGLYNRETVENLINNEIELVSARKNQFAILFIDVDDFKFFNDNYSHATGDQVLRFTAETINSIVGGFGIAGRYGGDEFVVCIRNSDVNDPSQIAQQMLNQLKAGFVCDVGDTLVVNVSIGIAIIKDSSRRVDEIIGMADDAMYKIKKSGKSNYGFI